jgi:predicted enzyme related to lactoylglutathione lyase
MGNAVVHFEIGAAEDEPLRAFYAELFGWGIQDMSGGGYGLIDTRAGSGINGGIGKSREGWPWVTFYVEADDLQAVLNEVEKRGGTTAVPVSEVPGIVTWAMFRDPDGLVVGLVQSEEPREGMQPRPSQGNGTPVDWFEVLGSDAAPTVAFYTDLFGWKTDDTMPGYSLIDTGAGRGIGGGIGGSSEGAGWATVYANVQDVEKTLARAEELGGSREYGPLAVDDHMRTGAFRDPAGNVFGVYHHPPH